MVLTARLFQSVGAELAPHKAHHDYYLMRSAHFPLYSLDWGADEELLLLEGVALCGLGNWPEVAQHVGTKLSDECRNHFFQVYVDSPHYPTPIDPLPEEQIRAALPMPVAPAVQEKKVIFKPGLSMPMKNHLGTFMPLRNEFDTPYNEEAEDIPADIVFNEDDTEEERALKVHTLQVYAAMLEERRRKTDFLVSLDLLDWKQHQQFDRSLRKEDATLVSHMRCFLQCQGKAAWERLVNGMLAEQHLRREIANYKSLREQGIKWLADAARLNQAAGSKSSKRLKSSSSSSNLAESSRHNLRSSGTFAKPAGAVPEPLAQTEVEYCEAFGMSADLYVAIKEACIRESCRAGGLGKKDARLLSPLPKHQTDQLYALFVSSGWVLPDRSGVAARRPRPVLDPNASAKPNGCFGSVPDVRHTHITAKALLAPPQL